MRRVTLTTREFLMAIHTVSFTLGALFDLIATISIYLIYGDTPSEQICRIALTNLILTNLKQIINIVILCLFFYVAT